MYYKFPRSLKGENTIGNLFSFSSIPFLVVGLIVWALLYRTIGIVSAMLAHFLGVIITLVMYLLSLFNMPEKNIFGGNNQKIYTIIFYVLTHKKVVYVPYIDKDENKKVGISDILFGKKE